MAETTGISWTQHTWNPWIGCTRVSPGCTNCYMFVLEQRWGRNPAVVRRSTTWSNPRRWNRMAVETGQRALVFTCSMSDFFHEDADEWRDEAWQVIRSCPNLVFQILTKRVDRIAENLPVDWAEGYQNVWLGTSIENNRYVWRADVLREVPARIRFISAEPLLGPMPDLDLSGIHWLIAGGESGAGYRQMNVEWARSLRDLCLMQMVAFFFKQSSGPRAGMGDVLDGREWKEYPEGYDFAIADGARLELPQIC